MRKQVRSPNVSRSIPRETVEGPLSTFSEILYVIERSIKDEGGWGDFPVLTAEEFEQYLSNPRTAYDVAGWILHSPWGAMSDLWGGWGKRPIDYQTWKYVRARLIRIRNECTDMGMKGRYTSYPPADYDAYAAIGRKHEPTELVKEVSDRVYRSLKSPQFTYKVERKYGRPLVYFIDGRLKGEDWTGDPGMFAHLSIENGVRAYFRVGSRGAAQYKWDMEVKGGNLDDVVSYAFGSAIEVHKELAKTDTRLTASNLSKVREIGSNLKAIADSLRGIAGDHVHIDYDPLTFTVRVDRKNTKQEFATAVIAQTKTGWNLVYRPYDADLIVRSCADINRVYAKFEDILAERLAKEVRRKPAPGKEVPKTEPPKKEQPKKEAPKKEAPKKEAPKKEVKPKAAKPKAAVSGDKWVYEVRLSGKMVAQFGSQTKAGTYMNQLKAQGLKPGVVKVRAKG